MAELGHIKILNERKVQMVELDIDMDEQTIDKLAHAGFNLIKYDRDELAAYAFRKALEATAKGSKECTLKIKSRSSKRSSRR